ncbi:MAG: indole-3-glycerol-phosphate synthase [Desulfovibrio sp.]|jgi:indole-3-glycerol phosphate synthase|nr:indole-3-glycerol-phosphate synthase [Desulfovibrio sp.]
MRLERFYAAKAGEIAFLRAAAGQGKLPEIFTGARQDFAKALRTPSPGVPLSVVAEYKRASPSRGLVCDSVSVEDAVLQYAQSGARAVSVLTEEIHFQGDMDFLARAAQAMFGLAEPLPLLRKDFIFDLLQVRATAASPASALLLIVKMTPDAGILRQLREETEKFGMQAVVEVFDAGDMRLARESGARIIQVNARNLDTLGVDRAACCRLAESLPPENGELWVAASGISRPEHLTRIAAAGFHAALVGSVLMARGRPGLALKALLQHRGDDPCL